MRWVGATYEPKVRPRTTSSYDLFGAHSAPLGRPKTGLLEDLGVEGLIAAILGMLIGAVAAAMEQNPAFNYHTWYYLSFASGSVGIWVISAVVIADISRTPREAAIRTASFLASALTMYFLVRYANYQANQLEMFEAASEQITGRISLIRDLSFWTAEKITVLVVGLLASALAAFDAWGIKRYAQSSHAYWFFALLPLFILAFEGWSYFVPMAIYASIGFVPAVVDVVGALACAWMIVRIRNERPALAHA